jgi:hypothetical protein
MGVAEVLDPQNGVALVASGSGNIPEWLVASQPDAQNLARMHPFEPEFGAHEGHRTDFAGNVDVMVGLYRAWVYGHVPNYTPNADRCRVLCHA